VGLFDLAAVAGLAAPRMWLAEGYSISPMGLPPFPASNNNALIAFSLAFIAAGGFLPRTGRWGGFDIFSHRVPSHCAWFRDGLLRALFVSPSGDHSSAFCWVNCAQSLDSTIAVKVMPSACGSVAYRALYVLRTLAMTSRLMRCLVYCSSFPSIA
jgi:hypothetical protein